MLLYFPSGLLSLNLHNYFLKVLFDLLLANFNKNSFNKNNNLLTLSDAPFIYGLGLLVLNVAVFLIQKSLLNNKKSYNLED